MKGGAGREREKKDEEGRKKYNDRKKWNGDECLKFMWDTFALFSKVEDEINWWYQETWKHMFE